MGEQQLPAPESACPFAFRNVHFRTLRIMRSDWIADQDSRGEVAFPERRAMSRKESSPFPIRVNQELHNKLVIDVFVVMRVAESFPVNETSTLPEVS